MEIKDNRDSIDFGSTNISSLFGKMFFPTLVGMLFIAIFTVTDGIFVGRGIGSDGLAAVNIIAPFFMITTGIGLMFGVGSSVVAAIHLSKNKVKAANINITQGLIVSTLMMSIICTLILLFPEKTVMLLGSSERLKPFAIEYLYYFAPFFVPYLIENLGLFLIRLDGSPKYAMACTTFPAILNIILDYLFIFPFGWGLKGAAFATGISVTISAIMVIVYLLYFSKTVKLYRLKLTIKSLQLSARNIGYQIKLGSSAMLGEAAIALLMFIGNIVFIRALGEDGVAAFSVACYCFPIVFMINNAVAQSGQPIISYNYGNNDMTRVGTAFKIMIGVAVGCGLVATLATTFGVSWLVSMFLDPQCEAYRIATEGMPYFSAGFIFFAFNIACIGYYQSIEKAKTASVFAIQRGFIFLIVSFILLPPILGVKGIWLAVPFSELLTACCIMFYYLKENATAKCIIAANK